MRMVDIKKQSNKYIIETVILVVLVNLLWTFAKQIWPLDVFAPMMASMIFVLVVEITSALVWRWVVQKHQQIVFSLALKMLCDEEEAKDMVQDTFIRVWLSIRDYDPQRTFTTWLYTIASRLCLDRLKRKNRILSVQEDELVLKNYASDTDSQRILENSEWISIVRLMADKLSAKQKLVFTLCQLEGLSSEEVQEITGFDARQVKSNLYAARQTIRKRLIELGYE